MLFIILLSISLIFLQERATSNEEEGYLEMVSTKLSERSRPFLNTPYSVDSFLLSSKPANTISGTFLPLNRLIARDRAMLLFSESLESIF